MDAIRELLARISELSAEELLDLQNKIKDRFEELRNIPAAELSDEQLAEMTSLADASDQVRTENEGRETAAQERQAAIDALAERMQDEPEDPPAEPNPEDPPQDPPADPSAEEPPADPPADPPAEDPKAVAAAAKPSKPPLSSLNRRVPSNAKPKMDRKPLTITAAAGVPNHVPGAEMDPEQVGEAFVERAMGVLKMPGRYPVAKFRIEYPEERVLTAQDAIGNGRKIDAAMSPQAIRAAVTAGGMQALTASGGLCAPVAPSYSLANISVADRPVRDSLPSFQATRGGVRFIEPPRITDLTSGITVWTAANDENPTSPTTKPCVVVTCGDEQEVVIQAIPLCIQIGNFSRRTFPEQFATWFDLGLSAHARVAEGEILDAIAASSTATTDATNLSVARDSLQALARAAAGYRSRNRMSENAPLQVYLPTWWKDAVREDLAMQQPGDNSLAVADAEINRFLSVRNLLVTYYMDTETGEGQVWGAETGGGLDPWPTTAVAYMFHPGAFMFLDGGTLDLGTEIRDSGLIETNDVRAFLETFEAVAFMGIESIKIEMTFCVAGRSSLPLALSCPGTGS